MATPRRPSQPPNRVDPGWVHETLARIALRLMSSQATAKLEKPIDVGEIPDDTANVISDDDSGTQPVDLLSRILAHLFHRMPGVKRIEKRLEGRDKNSGFWSDIFAFTVQLYRRNQPVIEEMVSAGIRARREQREATRAASPPRAPFPTDVPHVHSPTATPGGGHE